MDGWFNKREKIEYGRCMVVFFLFSKEMGIRIFPFLTFWIKS